MNVVFDWNRKLCTQDSTGKVNSFRMRHLLLLVDIGNLFNTSYFFIELDYSFHILHFDLMRYFVFLFCFYICHLFVRRELLVIVLLWWISYNLVYWCISYHCLIFSFICVELPTFYKSLCFNSFWGLSFRSFFLEVYSFVCFDYLILNFTILSFISARSIYRLFFEFGMLKDLK